MKGLINMTTYNTRTLATEVIGDDSKASTRTLRKFLRDHPTIEGVGKGGRYALDFTKPQLRKLTKEFAAWQVKQEEEKAKRAEALKATQESIILTNDEEGDDEDALLENEESDNGLDSAEGPTDEEIAAMLSDDEEEADEA